RRIRFYHRSVGCCRSREEVVYSFQPRCGMGSDHATAGRFVFSPVERRISGVAIHYLLEANCALFQSKPNGGLAMLPRRGCLVISFVLFWPTIVRCEPPVQDKPKAAPAVKQVRTDLYGDPLPPGAIARMGTVRFRHEGAVACVVFSPDGKILA